MRPLSVLFALGALASPAVSDVIAIRFKDVKTASKYKEHTVLRGGEPMVVGERIVEKGGSGSIDVGGTGGGTTVAPMIVIVANPDDPLKVPYKLNKQGEQDSVKNKLTIPADQIAGTVLLVKDGTLLSLAQDFADRRKEFEDSIAARNALAKGSAEWMSAQQQVITRGDRFVHWLRTTAFPGAANKLEREVAKERKLSADATAARLATAKASIKTAQVPQELIDVASEISGGTDKFSMMESLHCRMIYREGIDDSQATALLTLAEEIIDGWRTEFVDPYLDTAFEDYIQDRLTIEWFLGYDDVSKTDQYLTKYYRQRWDENKEERLKAAGHGQHRAVAPELLHYWKVDESADLEGMIAHNLGHDLAILHLDKGRAGGVQDWIEEGAALYVSLEWLGRNSVNCKSFAEPEKYVRQKKAGADRTAQVGLRDWYNAMALESGAPIDRLILFKLIDMGDGDLAKSWSYFDWIAKKRGKEGQLFLRQCCQQARTNTTFINELRAKAEEIFNITGQDVYKAIDKFWREFAELGQETGDTKRK